MQTRKVVKPGWNLEYVMWMFTRLSGLAITLLAVISVAAAFLMGARTQMDLGTLMRWTFFPNSNHVLDSEIPDVTLNWANGFWQIMQVLIVFFGVTHGFNGLRVVIEDYTKPGLWQLFWRAVVFLLWIFMALVGVYVVFTY
jgi:succinate dehydrogenase / fumarate reductase membrane anchor subunit